jgi:hypothetical protein
VPVAPLVPGSRRAVDRRPQPTVPAQDRRGRPARRPARTARMLSAPRLAVSEDRRRRSRRRKWDYRAKARGWLPCEKLPRLLCESATWLTAVPLFAACDLVVEYRARREAGVEHEPHESNDETREDYPATPGKGDGRRMPCRDLYTRIVFTFFSDLSANDRRTACSIHAWQPQCSANKGSAGITEFALPVWLPVANHDARCQSLPIQGMCSRAKLVLDRLNGKLSL